VIVVSGPDALDLCEWLRESVGLPDGRGLFEMDPDGCRTAFSLSEVPRDRMWGDKALPVFPVFIDDRARISLPALARAAEEEKRVVFKIVSDETIDEFRLDREIAEAQIPVFRFARLRREEMTLWVRRRVLDRNTHTCCASATVESIVRSVRGLPLWADAMIEFWLP
jgi:hypothetical protein